ncbi:MAG: HupE/UreJ family protein [Rhodocyclaceae bacterium]|nr:HupE/UreJ family protein [Rhodocyclaceae bacterium]
MFASMPCTRRCRDAAATILVLVLLLPAIALAHKVSDSYLTIGPVRDGEAELRWDIALRDLDLALDLDADGDRRLRWGELRARLPEIMAHAAAALAFDQGECPVAFHTLGIETRSDGNYLAMGAPLRCPAGGPTSVGYRLLGDLDPTHRGLLRIDRGDGTTAALSLDPNGGEQRLPTAGGSGLAAFFADGLDHILIGYDHLLFLLCLMLPAVLRRGRDGWRLVDAPRDALLPLLKTVTLFTIAHSVTLALASLEIVRLPPRWVEAAIAVSIVLAAVHNLRPRWPGAEPALAFGFGLVHGFGFANVLAGLSLPPSGFALALLGFNLGVEAGQLLVVATATLVLLTLGGRRHVARVLMPTASFAAIAIGGIWAVERVFDLAIIS